MTIIYFIRHAEPNYNNHNDALRELTQKGLKDRELVTQFLDDKNIDVVLSSPYKRSIDTIKPFAKKYNLEIEVIDDFRERKVDSLWIEDFTGFCMKQWNDFSYKLSDGETLGEVQDRNMIALMKVIEKHSDKNIVIGSHGTAMSTIINYFDNTFEYADFEKIKGLMPWIVKLVFDKESLEQIEMINILK